MLVRSFFRYSSVLIQTLVRVKPFFDTCTYSSVFIQTLVRVKPFFDTRLYVLSIIVHIDSNTRPCNLFLDIRLYLISILVHIDSNTRPCNIIPWYSSVSSFDTHPYWFKHSFLFELSLILIRIFSWYSSVLIQHSFVLKLSLILARIFFQYSSVLI